jgi:hypothetical protein
MIEPKDFAKLGEHLKEIDHFLDEFCIKCGYFVQKSVLGRFPQRRLEKHNNISYFFDLETTRSFDLFNIPIKKIPAPFICPQK